jgi:hypothetical protein
MRSVLLREARWFGANVAICIAWLFVVLLAQATVLLLASSGAPIADGWSGAPMAQVLGWATLGAWIGIFYATPVLALALIPYRLVVRAVGHPRAVAVAIAGAGIAVLALAVESPDPMWIALVASWFLGFAMLMRLPRHRVQVT